MTDGEALDGEVDHSFFDSDSEQNVGDGQRTPGSAWPIIESNPMQGQSSSHTSPEPVPSSSADGSSKEDLRTSAEKKCKHKLGKSVSFNNRGPDTEMLKKGKEGRRWSGSGSSSRSTSSSSSTCSSSSSPSSVSSKSSSSLPGKTVLPHITIQAAIQSASSGNSESEGESTEEEKKVEERSKSSKFDHYAKKGATRNQHHRCKFDLDQNVDQSSGSDSDISKGTVYHSLLEEKPSSRFSTSKQRPKSALKLSKEKHIKYLNNEGADQEDEDAITDVTPLSTPDFSPIQSVDFSENKGSRKQENVGQEIYDLAKSSPGSEKSQRPGKLSRFQRGEAASCHSESSTVSSARSKSAQPVSFTQRHSKKTLTDATDLNQLLKAFMHLEKEELQKIVTDSPAHEGKKNYSFTNEEIRCIDRENHRLLQELTRKASKSKSNISKKSSIAPIRVYHSTLNRHREQERIEKENLALLKRLEMVKPTVGLKRSEQLRDYYRHTAFMESCSLSFSQRGQVSGRASTSRGSSRTSSRKNFQAMSNSHAAVSAKSPKSGLANQS
uniref:Cilia- and flagella-associated protein 97 n=1 Tax=Callorhinchus milii TaxID=7868 RepID=V9KF99_CALMI